MKPYALRWMLVLVTSLALCPLRLVAQGAAEYATTTSAVGSLGAKIGSALGGTTKQVTPTLQQVLPNPTPASHEANPKRVAGKVVAEKVTAGKAAQGGAGTASGMSTVQIDSAPSGASITVDNFALGHTPASLTLSKGIHVIALIHDGCTSWQETILLTGGEKLSLNAALKDPKTSRPLFTVQR